MNSLHQSPRYFRFHTAIAIPKAGTRPIWRPAIVHPMACLGLEGSRTYEHPGSSKGLENRKRPKVKDA
eukprot:scaffold1299_cov385-Pavlova_lutheri.AAC.12